ncbi:coiled-coil-helix-coiled-coil-helix domain-containing protein 7 isoform X1 [Rhodnius prolixus]|uniref:coiled-coil-helix-coiled-coil-helix domain-containing protein 7 isoform X1 n=1 Tax=Rhodnius prolixus TaxID=13249 RepID=UPI003D18BC29
MIRKDQSSNIYYAHNIMKIREVQKKEKEHNMSLNCLSQNHYSPDECQKQFQNYKLCKTFWNEVRRYRRINGISPLLPPLNERESVKAKYFETGKFS